MKHTHTTITVATTLLMMSSAPVMRSEQCVAVTADNDSILEDFIDDQADMRQNPVIESELIELPFSGHVPSFIRRSKNAIKYNGEDFSTLYNKLASPGSRIDILHIGDSHVQAEFSTQVTRDMLQFVYGDAGRGLVAPLKLASTNPPSDYKVESTSSWTATRAIKSGSDADMGFNGLALRLSGATGNLTFVTRDDEDTFDPFAEITLFGKGKIDVVSVTDQEGNSIPYESVSEKNCVRITLGRSVNAATVRFSATGGYVYYGSYLSGLRPGLTYSVIGNNGATFSTYNSIGSFSSGISCLAPDLVIVALGTNEAFGRLDRAALRSSLQSMANNIRRGSPKVPIILVTPMECQRRSYVRRKGRRRRAASYSVNANVAAYRNEILDFGRKHNIAVYDLYDVAGGEGASSRWLDAGLMGKDRVHLTASGYRLQGMLLYEALMNLFEPKQ